jgi:hypothetical protein
MQDNLLLNTLTKYVRQNSDQAKGLFLLDLPTGFGKTHAVLSVMFDVYKDSERKIVFLTDLKKNLPHLEFQKRFFKDNPEDYKRDVVFLNSHVDHLIQGIETIKSQLPIDILQSPEFNQLYQSIKDYNNLLKTEKRFAETLKTTIIKETEQQFRSFLKGYFSDLPNNKHEKIAKIKKDYAWLPLLYPSVLSAEKRVLFMSLDKFLWQNDPIIAASHAFFDDDFLKNALIVIDECDASKDILLKNIIETSLQRQIDIISLLRHIHAAFEVRDLPRLLVENSAERNKRFQNKGTEKARLNDRRTTKNIPEVIKQLKKEIGELDKKYRLKFNFKTTERTTGRRFLFHNWRYQTVVSDDRKYIVLRCDEADKLNKITFLKEKSVEEEVRVRDFMNDIQQFLNRFSYELIAIARNYREQKQMEATDETPDFSLDNALKTLLDALSIPSEFYNFLIESTKTQHQTAQQRYKKGEKPLPQTLTFYEKGYRYYGFEDRDQHDTQSKIYVAALERTPETWLAEWATNNLVVGISATAKIETVVGNYDLSYLRQRLGTRFIEMTVEERVILRGAFDKRFERYSEVSLQTKFLKVDTDIRRELHDLFPDDDNCVNYLTSELEKQIIVDDDEGNRMYYHQRIIRVAKAFDYFVKHDDCQSFLCFLNAHPKKDNPRLPLSILAVFFQKILKKQDKTAISWEVLASQNFDEEKVNLLKRLSAGEKIFVITAYQTLGAGQNVQYDAPNTANLIQIFAPFDETKTPQKDFDGIYLDMPTNLVVNLKGENLTEFDLNRRLFQVQMLAEKGDIAPKHLRHEVDEAFRSLFQAKMPYRKPPEGQPNLRTTSDFRQLVLQQIIQAVGRIGRTNLKSKNIRLLADFDLVQHLQTLDTEGSLFSPEMIALHNAALEMVTVEAVAENPHLLFENKASLNNLRGSIWIKSKIRGGFRRPQDIADWQRLRQEVLQKPTISAAELAVSPFPWAYIALPEPAENYFYTQKNDFEVVEVSFQRHLSNQVSAAEVKLSNFLRLSEITELFQSEGFATQFTANDYILSPIVFNNIYKGALGEVIGKCVLEKRLGLVLDEMSNTDFEQFDYRIKSTFKDKNGFYTEGSVFDFKFWNERKMIVEQEAAHAKIRSKLDRVGARQVAIINMFSSAEYEFVASTDGRILEVPRLVDLEKGCIDDAMIQQLVAHLKFKFV